MGGPAAPSCTGEQASGHEEGPRGEGGSPPGSHCALILPQRPSERSAGSCSLTPSCVFPHALFSAEALS